MIMVGADRADRRDRPVRIGVQLAPQHGPYSAIRDAVLRAEDLGVDMIVGWDHFFPLTEPYDGEHYEAWTVLAAIAEQTERVEFGPLVNCNSYRNPDLQADMARTIDHISAGADGVGRFVFGTGSGWAPRDYEEYGFEFGTAGSRLDALAVDVPRIRDRWTKLNPPPTRDIPILIGGGGERKTLKIVAEHADIWHSFADLDSLRHKISVLHGWCAEVGRDPAEIEISTGTSIRGLGFVDADTIGDFVDAGVTLFTPAIDGPDYDMTPVKALLDWRDAQA